MLQEHQARLGGGEIGTQVHDVAVIAQVDLLPAPDVGQPMVGLEVNCAAHRVGLLVDGNHLWDCQLMWLGCSKGCAWDCGVLQLQDHHLWGFLKVHGEGDGVLLLAMGAEVFTWFALSACNH